MIIILLLLPATTMGGMQPLQVTYTPSFDSARAYEHLVNQCDFGPRPPGSENLSRCRGYIADVLEDNGWTVVFQNFTYNSVDCSNIIAYYGSSNNASILLGAHYDTRPVASSDPSPENRTLPIIGANDGASGVAVLLELAASLPTDTRENVELIFFDAEDSGYVNGWDWIVGSTYYVDELPAERISQIRAMILLDMVGDSNLRLLREAYSTVALQDMVWNIARDMGHDDVFLDSPGAHIIDDHRPFLDAGIPSLDIIQHDPFPWYWHTLEDTPDKCSAESLGVVGGVVETFVVNITESPTTFAQVPAVVPWLLLIIPIIALTVVVLYIRRK